MDCKCVCEAPGYYNSGVPGIVAHVEKGKVASRSAVERCDTCMRYATDTAAEVELAAFLSRA